MFARFVCALSFRARKFPAKSETREPGKIIVECTSYCYRLRREKFGACPSIEQRTVDKWQGTTVGGGFSLVSIYFCLGLFGIR